MFGEVLVNKVPSLRSDPAPMRSRCCHPTVKRLWTMVRFRSALASKSPFKGTMDRRGPIDGAL